MEIKDLPITMTLVHHLIDKYGLNYTQALELVSDLNCENINGYKTTYGGKTVELFTESCDEIQGQSLKEKF